MQTLPKRMWVAAATHSAAGLVAVRTNPSHKQARTRRHASRLVSPHMWCSTEARRIQLCWKPVSLSLLIGWPASDSALLSLIPHECMFQPQGATLDMPLHRWARKGQCQNCTASWTGTTFGCDWFHRSLVSTVKWSARYRQWPSALHARQSVQGA